MKSIKRASYDLRACTERKQSILQGLRDLGEFLWFAKAEQSLHFEGDFLVIRMDEFNHCIVEKRWCISDNNQIHLLAWCLNELLEIIIIAEALKLEIRITFSSRNLFNTLRGFLPEILQIHRVFRVH